MISASKNTWCCAVRGIVRARLVAHLTVEFRKLESQRTIHPVVVRHVQQQAQVFVGAAGKFGVGVGIVEHQAEPVAGSRRDLDFGAEDVGVAGVDGGRRGIDADPDVLAGSRRSG